ncbi:BAR adaptor protein, endophilin A1-like protein-like protein, implicated in endocytosis [Schizosaccharomyces osmophilus]|uniref:BAR adaptor protein, endophilin A1-like protein-like protein, implicated in endocytosis n=1 Tax=Schizosaccharomyces osmophilus TaxID=2545709 RepID=A0AAF0AUR2_9SCHI|nr:BAR adaptor protein, endophilin A1-like protein-like protein, implicated in endocytosis [Schizosaccharomyces osmophilus]WBW72766.1 BAR adaptor protein, endophilin A1-like protein-like protein, implicated in endocytosis [Schizosaccharomyces osmophilus]
MNKHFARFSQWTGERFGFDRQKTTLSDDFCDLQREMELRFNGTEKVHRNFSQWVQSMGRRKSPLEEQEKAPPITALGDSFLNLGYILSDYSVHSDTYNMYGKTLIQIGALQENFIHFVTESYMKELDGWLSQKKVLEVKEKKLENRRLVFDALSTKIQKAKKEDSKIEEELRMARGKYENTLEDFEERMIELRELESSQVSKLVLLLHKQTQFHEQCLNILRSLESQPFGESQQPTNHSKRSYSTKSFASSPSVIYKDPNQAMHPRLSSPSLGLEPTSWTAPTSFDAGEEALLPANYLKNLEELQLGDASSQPSVRKSSSPEIPIASKPVFTGRTSLNSVVPRDGLERSSCDFEEDRIPKDKMESGHSSSLSEMPTPTNSLLEKERASASQNSKSLSTHVGLEVVRMKYQFEPQMEDELALKKDDLLLVLKKVDDGWWVGEQLNDDGSLTGNTGLFPSNFCFPENNYIHLDKIPRTLSDRGSPYSS